ncbi:MAG TPA: L,D-transpeptidase family protein [Chitinophagaceae bacterium]|nr:L,D-transpeptidase family protein [Chitinophagaceae bacterium]
MARRRLLLYALLLNIFGLKPALPFAAPAAKDTLAANQIIVVLTTGWDTAKATLYAFEKINGVWVQQFTNPVFVGAKGMGIGDGLVPLTINGAPVKKEGDLKAPAGIFKIGAAFGYADKHNASWIKDAYIQADDTVFCVDDARSIYYNQIISADTAHSDWHSFEYMHRKDDDYKWGLFVEHNSPVTVPGHGSCIFIHIGTGNNFATEGCTAMTETNLLGLLHWIDASKKPLLIQMPLAAYTIFEKQFNLPVIH